MRELRIPKLQLAILTNDQIRHFISLTRLCTIFRVQLDREPAVSLLGRLFACHFIHRPISHFFQYLQLFSFIQVPTSDKEKVSSPKSILRQHSAPPEKIAR